MVHAQVMSTEYPESHPFFVKSLFLYYASILGYKKLDYQVQNQSIVSGLGSYQIFRLLCIVGHWADTTFLGGNLVPRYPSDTVQRVALA